MFYVEEKFGLGKFCSIEPLVCNLITAESGTKGLNKPVKNSQQGVLELNFRARALALISNV